MGKKKLLFQRAKSLHLYSQEYLNILSVATAKGYQHPSEEQNILNDIMIKKLIDINAWDEIDTLWYFQQDCTMDFARINWKEPTKFELYGGVTPNLIPNIGIKVGTQRGWLKTGFQPLRDAVKCVKLNSSLILKTIALSGTLRAFGGRTGNNTEQTYMRIIENKWTCRHYGSDPDWTISAGGHYHFSGLGNVGKRYLNGNLSQTTTNVTSGTINNVEQYVLAINGATGSSDTFQGLAYMLQGSSLEAEQQSIYQILNNNY